MGGIHSLECRSLFVVRGGRGKKDNVGLNVVGLVVCLDVVVGRGVGLAVWLDVGIEVVGLAIWLDDVVEGVGWLAVWLDVEVV